MFRKIQGPGIRVKLPCFAAGLFMLAACGSSVDEEGYFVTGDVAKLEGVWQSEGYGYLLEVTDSDFQLYDATASFCVRNDDFAGPVEDFPAPFRLAEDGSSFKITPSDPAYQQTLVKIETLPAACSVEAATDPEFVFRVFDELFRTHYAFFEERGVDWDALIAEARPQITPDMDEQALFDVLAGIVNQIDDGHVSLRAEIAGEAQAARPGRGKTGRALARRAAVEGIEAREMTRRWRDATKAETDEIILQGNGTVTGNGWIRYGLINGDIGYISIMTETAYSDEEDDGVVIERIMDEAMTLFAGAKAVIVDISLNHGGDDRISRRIARRFATEMTLGYSKYAGDAKGAKPQDIYLRPNEAPGFTGPVYLLTSDHTVSAGEILTMSLRALPNVTHLGEATRGALSDILAKPLPNGWLLLLSNEVYLDHEGILWEGRGIPPEVTLPVYSEDDPFKGHVEAVAAVVEMIEE